MSDTIERFSNRVANYVKYRPDYPREVTAYLEEKGIIYPGTAMADIGCGTGISTRMFLETGCPVTGVEPNDNMRAAAVEFLSDFPLCTMIDGTSTATTLSPASVDMVAACQAFHWFEPEPTRAEFRRILRPGGSVVLIWNLRQVGTTPFLVDYERFLLSFATDYVQVRHDNINDDEIDAFFGRAADKAVFQNRQVLDLDGLTGRALSSSYVPAEDSDIYPKMSADLRELFAKHERDGKITIFYDTCVYHSRI